MKRIIVLCLCIILLLISSCAQKELIPCREILGKLIDAEVGLPAGQIYDLAATEGDDEYLDERLINSLFGEGASPPMRSGWIDLALFLPTSSHPCEFAIFLCDTPDTATDTARILCRRLDIVKTSKKDAANSSILDSATVTIIGNYVLLIISSDTQNAIKIAANLMR